VKEGENGNPADNVEGDEEEGKEVDTGITLEEW